MQPGDPITALSRDAYNDLLDHLDERGRRRTGQVVTPQPQPQMHARIRNDSGSDLDQFSVLGIDGPVIGPGTSSGQNTQQFKQELALSGVTPSMPDHLSRMAVIQQPLKAGVIGDAVVDGVTVVRANLNHTGPQALAPGNGSTNLEPAQGGGAFLLWASGTGTDVWAIVTVGVGADEAYIKITGRSSAGVFTGDETDAAGTVLTNGRSLTVHDLNGKDSWYVVAQPLVVRVARGVLSDGSERWVIVETLGTTTSLQTRSRSSSKSTKTWNRTQPDRDDGGDGFEDVQLVGRPKISSDGTTLTLFSRKRTYDSLGHVEKDDGATEQKHVFEPATSNDVDTRINLTDGSLTIQNAAELKIAAPLKLVDEGNKVGRLEIDWSQIAAAPTSENPAKVLGKDGNGNVKWYPTDDCPGAS